MFLSVIEINLTVKKQENIKMVFLCPQGAQKSTQAKRSSPGVGNKKKKQTINDNVKILIKWMLLFIVVQCIIFFGSLKIRT